MSKPMTPRKQAAALYAEVFDLGKGVWTLSHAERRETFKLMDDKLDKLKQLGEVCEGIVLPSQTTFWNQPILLAHTQGKYNRINPAESLAALFLSLGDGVGTAHVLHRIDTPQEFPSLAAVFPNAASIEFHVEVVPEGATAVSETTRMALFTSAKDAVRDDLRRIDWLLQELRNDATAATPALREVLKGRLTADVKKRKRDEPQHVDLFGIELRDNLSTLRNLRVTEFRGHVGPHLVELFGRVSTFGFPKPLAPKYTSGVILRDCNGALVYTGSGEEVDGDMSVQQLLESKYPLERIVYLKLQRDAHALRSAIDAVVAKVRHSFRLVVHVLDAQDEVIQRITDLRDTMLQQALAAWFLKEIAQTEDGKEQGEEEDEEEDGGEEDEEEDGGEEDEEEDEEDEEEEESEEDYEEEESDEDSESGE